MKDEIDINELERPAIENEDYLRKRIRDLEGESKGLRERLGEQKEFHAQIAAAVAAQQPYPAFKYRTNGSAKRKSLEVVPNLDLSDLHIGEVVEADEVEGFNKFNWQIAQEGLFGILEDFLQWVEIQREHYRIRRCALTLKGDYVSGDIHDELKATNEWPLPVQTAKAGWLLGEVFRILAGHFDELTAFEIGADNHGRLQKKPQAKQKTANSMSFLVHYIANAAAEKCRNFRPITSVGLKYLADINGQKFLIEHGDTMKCFVPDSMIFTPDGLPAQIGSIESGLNLISGDGTTKPAAAIHRLKHDGEVTVIEANMLPDPAFRCTTNHKVLAVVKQRGRNADPEFVPAGYLSEGDWLIIPRPRPERLVDGVNVFDLGVNPTGHYKEKHLPEEIKLTYNMGYLLGWYLGDGSFTGAGVEIAFHSEEEAWADKFLCCCQDVIVFTGKKLKRNLDRKVLRVQVYSKQFGMLLKALGGGGARTKKLHSDYLSWPNEMLEGVLEGYLQADGHTARHSYHERHSETARVGASTMSISLGWQIFWMAMKLGYCPSYKIRTRSGSKEGLLNFFSEDARKLGEKTQRNFKFTEGQTFARKVLSQPDHVRVQITKAYREHYSGPVIDLTIPGNECYVCGGVSVHNSWMGIPHYGIQRATGREALRRMNTDKGFNYFSIGHWHVPSFNQKLILINGSLSGTSEFDHACGRHSDPCQCAYLVHPHYGVFNFTPFVRKDVKKLRAQGKTRP